MMIWLGFCLLWQGQGGEDVLWRHHLHHLRANVETDRLYAVKQTLASLKRLDPARYEREELALTAAWAAARERHWGTAFDAYAALDARDPYVLLEKVRMQSEAGRYEAALATAAASPIGLTRDQRLELRAILAHGYRQLNRFPPAIEHYKAITRAKAPLHRRLEAHYYLAVMYYKTGQTRSARAHAERLQRQWPASDEALYAIQLQEQWEDPDYLDRTATLDRMARAAYRNREFERAKVYYAKIIASGRGGKEVDRSRYFSAVIHNKEDEPERAASAFHDLLPLLAEGTFAGPAAFQLARALFMSGRDREAVDFCDRYWRDARGDKGDKWAQECAKLQILALRRQSDYGAFQRLESRARGARATDLAQFYYRNGVSWALRSGLADEALDYLARYRRLSLDGNQRKEAALWEGLVYWELGQEARAAAIWIDVVETDPNHFFGLVARQLLLGSDPARHFQARISAADLAGEKPKTLAALYHLAPAADRERIGRFLIPGLPPLDLDADFDDLPRDGKAHRYARIGRFDWAARALTRSDVSGLTFHYLKSKWFLIDGRLHQSIYHGEILAKAYPRWMPYELIPEPVQQLIYPEGFSRIVHEKAKTYKVDPYLLLAIIREESRFDAQAKSYASARGLMQFIPATAVAIAREVGIVEDFSLPMLYDPEVSITLGARYVDKLMSTFQGRSLCTVAAYNAGEGAVLRWASYSDEDNPLQFVWDVTYRETKNYCQKVLRAYHHYTRVYDHKATPIRLAPRLTGP